MNTKTQAVATVSESTSIMQVIERAAANPDVDVDKLERLLAVRERIVAKQDETAFNDAMTMAQAEMTRISADARNPQTSSKYASYAQLDRALRPIYTKHGFSLSFGTADSPKPDHVRITCLVAKSGYSRDYQIDMPSDGKGARGGDVMTKTHATGAATSYGARYLLKLIFNVAVGEDDTDGNDPAPVKHVPLPDGYMEWHDNARAVADEGHDKLVAFWKASPQAYRNYATSRDSGWWSDMKARAAKVAA